MCMCGFPDISSMETLLHLLRFCCNVRSHKFISKTEALSMKTAAIYLGTEHFILYSGILHVSD